MTARSLELMCTDRHRAFPMRQRWACLALLLLLACTHSGPPRVQGQKNPPGRASEQHSARQASKVQQPDPPTAAAEPRPKDSGPAPEESQQTVRPPSPPPTPDSPLLIESGQRPIRVGLATDLAYLHIPCCNAQTTVRMGRLTLHLDAPVDIEPAGELNDLEFFRLQVAALKDEGQAKGIAERLRQALDKPADAVFDAGTDLYRVRVGHYPNRQAAEAGRGELEAMGIVDAWVASEGGDLEHAALRIRQGGKSQTVAGRWLLIDAQPDTGIHLAKKGRFRGRILVYLNRRGRLNLINELSIEDYLRGVVPMEMGPELYNQLEALKAQTVAARTYAVRNLGEFADEGYDICSSPRCQVYGGMAVEHPFSDRAVRETRGQVALFEGQPAETFYSATCGGHTENVEVVFPLKRGPYLRGVPCLESGEQSLSGSQAHGSQFPAALTHLLLPPGSGSPEQILGRRLRHLATLLEVSIPKDHLHSRTTAELRRFLASIFDLALDPRLLAPRARLVKLLQKPPRTWRERDLALAAYFVQDGLASTTKTPVSAAQAERLLLRLALYFGVLEASEAHFLSLGEGHIEVRRGLEHQSLAITSRLVTFQGSKAQLRVRPLSLMAGDRLRLYLHRGSLLAAAQSYDPHRVVLGKRRPRGPWRHFRSHSDIRRAVQTRYPGFPFRDFEILSRGVSGRVGRLLLYGDGNRQLTVSGLPVRWTLDLPDTRFTARRHRPKNSEAGWIFSGSGWGHGVGMCQTGTFGMAMRGATYQEILNHYYTGIELGSLAPPEAHSG